MATEHPSVLANLEAVMGSMRSAGTPSDSWAQKSCCGALYELEPVRLLLGDTLHPGGLALTHRLGKLMGIERGQLVLDIACGRGTSTLAVARSFHCRSLARLGARKLAAATALRHLSPGASRERWPPTRRNFRVAATA